MNHRLQVRISAELDAQIEKAAEHGRMSKAERVRRALKESLQQASMSGGAFADPLARMASLNGPVGNIDQMLAEIGRGRS